MLRKNKTLASIRYFVRRMFRLPFERLPPEFGDTVPPELREFEARAEESEHHAVGHVSSPESHGHARSKAAQRGSFLEKDK